MARIPRHKLFHPKEVGIYYCVKWCVRRAHLCGRDPETGKSYEHRQAWLREWLELLAGEMGVDILGYSILSNRIQVVVRNRPDVVKKWSNTDVARRWWNLFPERRRLSSQQASGPSRHDLHEISTDRKRIADARERLSDLSWFMRSLSEPVARRANVEDSCQGRFWEARFKCVPVLDDAALLACLAHVDLAGILAGSAKSLESSKNISVRDRILSLSRERGRGLQAKTGWLSPFSISFKKDSSKPAPAARASNTGCLEMSFDDYRQVLKATARQLRKKKPGAMPEEIEHILTQHSIAPSGWLTLVSEFGGLFRRSAGMPDSIERDVARAGKLRRDGISVSREAFVESDE